MGNVPSADGTDATTTPTPQGGTKLYKYLDGSSIGSWELVANAAELNLYDANEDARGKKPEWHLEVDGAQETVNTVVDENFSFVHGDSRVAFVAGDEIWALKFSGAAPFDRFLQRYNEAMFANSFGPDATQEKMFGADFRLGQETEESRQLWVADMDVDQPAPGELRTPTKDRLVADRASPIHGVVMGAGDRSYLIRDSQIDVMRNVVGGVEDAGLVFKVTPPPRAASRGASRTPTITPSKAILMAGETKMNMLSPLSTTSLFHTDIETGKVVSEWAFQKDGVDVPIKDIVTDNKSAQLEERSTFLGLDTNRLARWDLRDPHGVVQEMSSPIVNYVGGKDYSRGTKFSCMATSGAGFVVVGSDDGKIRLYSEKTLTQAKTAIPGLGLPITNVDVTYDGKWVLATTRSYLMVLKTTYRDPTTGKELCGFTSKMGANAPAPRLLRLKTEDVRLTKNAPLEKGHFTWVTEQGRQERWIVASCGNYTVLWNFRSVKVAEPDTLSFGGLTTVTNYHLVNKSEHVVDSVFMHDKYSRGARGGETSMVVVTKNKVYAVADEDSEED